MDTSTVSALIKQEALRLGFSACGICRPEFIEEYAVRLQQWLDHGFHGAMNYMARYTDKRSDPRILLENTQSIVVVALNYYPQKKQHPDAAQLAYYAYGKDYHLVVKEKLRNLYTFINKNITPVQGRIFCDTAPFSEKYHAVKAGLGWIGKNTQLIIPGKGSFFFLGAMLLDIPLPYDEAFIHNRCGNCRKCMDACPTGALIEPGQLNANRCLSYLTIEYKGILPDFYAESSGNCVYGCDICNKVCPWNNAPENADTEEFQLSENKLNLTVEKIEQMTGPEFDDLFQDSPVHRIGLNQLKRNVLSKQTTHIS